MTGYGALSVLTHMLENADRVKPWKTGDFEDLNISQSTLHRYLRFLSKTQLIVKVSGGYVLGSLILEAGAKFQLNLQKINPLNNQENIYG